MPEGQGGAQSSTPGSQPAGQVAHNRGIGVGTGIGIPVSVGVVVACAGRTFIVRLDDEAEPSSDFAASAATKAPAAEPYAAETVIVKFREPSCGMLADLGKAEMLQHDAALEESDTLLASAFPPFATVTITVPFPPGIMPSVSDGKNDEMPILGGVAAPES